MSDVDFQNGFLCGLATKGLTKGAGATASSSPFDTITAPVSRFPAWAPVVLPYEFIVQTTLVINMTGAL